MVPADYLATARRLLGLHTSKPRQSDLRKSVSAAYYALFYALCRNCADCLIGTSGADKSGPAWRQVFRSVEHGYAKRQCMNQQVMAQFPQEIRSCASKFAALQAKRQEVDYDPDARLDLEEAQTWLDAATLAIDDLGKAPLKDRRAFAAWVTMKARP